MFHGGAGLGGMSLLDENLREDQAAQLQRVDFHCRSITAGFAGPLPAFGGTDPNIDTVRALRLSGLSSLSFCAAPSALTLLGFRAQ